MNGNSRPEVVVVTGASANLERVEGGKHFVPEDHPEPAAVKAVQGASGAG